MWHATEERFDAIVLDVVLPDIDGFEVTRRLRRANCLAPLLLLTARDDVPDRVRGLDAGADDYLTKPFAFEELFARIRSLVRRGPRERSPILKAGDLMLEFGGHLFPMRRADARLRRPAAPLPDCDPTVPHASG